MSASSPIKNTRVAYFCMEYGLDAAFPIYSGGLGVLAGDHLKSCRDLDLPLIGIGMLWDEGYVRQRLNPSGQLEDYYVKTPRDKVIPTDARFTVEVEGEPIECTCYRAGLDAAVDLYLIEPVAAEHQWITKRLYGGDGRTRVAQEMLLGIGGVRLLRALGINVERYHFNEGHAALAGLELISEEMSRGKTFDDARKALRPKVVFTTHTPVPAGNEEHSFELLEKMGATLSFGEAELQAIGDRPFSMTKAGLRLASKSNAVAQLHAETAREMWALVEGASILGITNGVHPGTWQDKDISNASTSEDLWRTHMACKSPLLDLIRKRTAQDLDGDGLLVGFARRAAPYKRGNLILSDEKRFEKLIADHKIAFVFSGKAHPKDARGKEILDSIVTAAKRWPKNVAFLEDYDMELGAALTRGCDVWLNNPRRPQEACGTSGMKAAMNGVLNLSILDGWWPEGCRHGETGWRIPSHEEADTLEERDARELDALFQLLEHEVLPAYANRNTWTSMMRASIEMSEAFSSHKMVRAYFEKLY